MVNEDEEEKIQPQVLLKKGARSTTRLDYGFDFFQHAWPIPSQFTDTVWGPITVDPQVCRTPPTEQLLLATASFLKSPPHSRFNFARSVDPIEGGEAIDVPRVVRELLERGIRTLSNSLGHKSLEGPSPVGPVPDLINFNDDWPAIKDFKNVEEDDGGESPPREKNKQ